MRGRIKLLAAIVALGSTACGPGKRKLVLPDVPQLAAKPLPEVAIETPPPIETPLPTVPVPGRQLSPAQDPSKLTPAEEKKPQQARTPVPVVSTETEAPSTVVQPQPTPRLGEFLTDSRRVQYEADFKRFMSGARAALKRASLVKLNDSQQLTVTRIKSFLEQ